MGIREDAWEGTLYGDVLDKYHQSDPASINELDPVKGIPPLTAATIQGHVGVVEELLKKGAQADRKSTRGEPPLVLAWRARQNRARIIQLLLEKIPSESVDATCDHAENNTPLMLIIKETRPIDIESVRQLRKAGASLTAENDDGYDAEQLARTSEDDNLVRALHPDEEQADNVGLVIKVVSFLRFIFASMNRVPIRGIIKGVFRRLYGLNPALDPNLHREVNAEEPRDKEEFLENINTYVSTSSLRKFFPPGSRFIQELAEKAAELRDDPTTPLGNPSLVQKTILVTMHQQVIYCDDSGSMYYEKRFDSLKQLVKRITRITTRILPDNEGVALRFINQDSPSRFNFTLEGVDSVLADIVKPSGGTAIGTNLKTKILGPLVYRKLNSPEGLVRPLLVSVITDGDPTNEASSAFVEAITECGKKLTEKGYPRESVKFLVSQIGTDKKAENFLKSLKQESGIQDVVFCTSDQLDAKFHEFKENEGKIDRWLIETLCSPIMMRD